jgi:hypothetical protein
MIETIILAIALFSGGFYVGNDFQADKQSEIRLAEERTLKSAQEGAAIEIAKIKILHTTIENKLIERIRTEKVYAECRHSSDAFKLLQEAFDD